MTVECSFCKKPMDVDTCTYDYVELNGEFYERDCQYFDVNERCHDCGILNKNGNFHHPHCDIERCPRCGGQLISCNCENKLFCRKIKNDKEDTTYVDNHGIVLNPDFDKNLFGMNSMMVKEAIQKYKDVKAKVLEVFNVTDAEADEAIQYATCFDINSEKDIFELIAGKLLENIKNKNVKNKCK